MQVKTFESRNFFSRYELQVNVLQQIEAWIFNWITISRNLTRAKFYTQKLVLPSLKT